jgi:hypothetical protein
LNEFVVFMDDLVCLVSLALLTDLAEIIASACN